MIAISFAVAAAGMVSTNSRTVNGSGRVPSKAWLAPTMSLLNMPCTSSPAAFIWAAMWADPYSPCSSPATTANTSVPGNWRLAGDSVQSLPFAGHGGEHHRAGELAGGEQPGELEHHRDAGRVVIGAGSVAGEVQHVGHPGVQVAGDDIEALGGCGALQCRDHVGDRGRHRDVGRDRLGERLLLDRHPAPRGGRDGLHLVEDPGRGRADATYRIGLA